MNLKNIKTSKKNSETKYPDTISLFHHDYSNHEWFEDTLFVWIFDLIFRVKNTCINVKLIGTKASYIWNHSEKHR